MLKKTSLIIIDFYQKHLSPYKGYKCAYNFVHGGMSCSAYGKLVIEKEGALKGFSLIKKRIHECRNAMVLIVNDPTLNHEHVLKASWGEISSCLQLGADATRVLDDVDNISNRNNRNNQPGDCL